MTYEVLPSEAHLVIVPQKNLQVILSEPRNRTLRCTAIAVKASRANSEVALSTCHPGSVTQAAPAPIDAPTLADQRTRRFHRKIKNHTA
jgi:hypothetical protein